MTAEAHGFDCEVSEPNFVKSLSPNDAKDNVLNPSLNGSPGNVKLPHRLFYIARCFSPLETQSLAM